MQEAEGRLNQGQGKGDEGRETMAKLVVAQCPMPHALCPLP
jgi:hypothetical protein